MVIDFLKLQPPVFIGEGNPMLSDKWLEEIEKCLDTMVMGDDATHIRLATFQLRDATETWWKSTKNTTPIATMIWVMFERLFLEQFFLKVIQDAKRKEFIALI